MGGFSIASHVVHIFPWVAISWPRPHHRFQRFSSPQSTVGALILLCSGVPVDPTLSVLLCRTDATRRKPDETCGFLELEARKK